MLLGSSRKAIALAAARHLCAHAAELSEQTLERILRHLNDDVRQVGTACVLARCDETNAPAVLDD
jgi:hypothetical protein